MTSPKMGPRPQYSISQDHPPPSPRYDRSSQTPLSYALFFLKVPGPSFIRRLHTRLPRIDGRPGAGKVLLGGHLSNLPTPAAQGLDHLGRDGRRERDPDEDEGFVYGVGEGELGPETCGRGRRFGVS